MTSDGRTDGDALVSRLRSLVASNVFELPQPGCGATGERLRRLAAISAADLSAGRLAEAHLDAITILREAGREPEDGALYGVWASDAPHARLELLARPHGRLLTGRKAFCTGAGLVDRALVTAHSGGGVLLVDLATTDGVEVDGSGWITEAFASTATASIDIAGLGVSDAAVIGSTDWYLDRVGFWLGALAPAACWAGGAIGLVDHCFGRVHGRSVDDHTLAHLGVLDSARWDLGVVLDAAGAAADDARHDAASARHLAMRTRTVVERVVTLTVDHAVRAFGPQLLANDAWAERRIAELQLYVRQHHDARDHAALGRETLEREPAPVDHVHRPSSNGPTAQIERPTPSQ